MKSFIIFDEKFEQLEAIFIYVTFKRLTSLFSRRNYISFYTFLYQQDIKYRRICYNTKLLHPCK